MNMTIALASMWVVAATIVAMLPLHHQFRPGSLLLVSAPPMITLLAMQYGVLVGLLAVAAFVSMFRHPLRFYGGKLVQQLGSAG